MKIKKKRKLGYMIPMQEDTRICIPFSHVKDKVQLTLS